MANSRPRPAPTAFGKWLKTSREQKGLTLEALAVAAGIHRVSVSKLEAGTVREPTLSVARRLAVALGQTLSDIPEE